VTTYCAEKIREVMNAQKFLRRRVVRIGYLRVSAVSNDKKCLMTKKYFFAHHI